MKLCVVGLGYIGLPTALLFANKGVNVVGVDIDVTLVENINEGKILIEEDGLHDILIKVNESGIFRATVLLEKANVFVIAVPTPVKNDKWKSCDLTNVLNVIDEIVPILEKGNTVIIESTIPPKAIEKYIKPKIEAREFIIGKDIYVAYCPERVIPGNILHEFTYNSRIVGGVTPKCNEKATNFYRKVVKGEILSTDAKTAEMVKLMENIYRDVNISLANECFKICHELEINVLEVIKLANEHPRVNIHHPSAGVGGHCLAIDPYFVISQVPDTAELLRLSRHINESMPIFVVEVVKKIMQRYNGKKITILGVSYKGNIADTRESPALEIYNSLKKLGDFELAVYDPFVDLEFVGKNIKLSLQDADLAIILADHDEFKTLTHQHFSIMKQHILFDTKHIVENLCDNIEYIHFGNLHSFVTLPLND